jgi:hypothetical protein
VLSTVASPTPSFPFVGGLASLLGGDIAPVSCYQARKSAPQSVERPCDPPSADGLVIANLADARVFNRVKRQISGRLIGVGRSLVTIGTQLIRIRRVAGGVRLHLIHVRRDLVRIREHLVGVIWAVPSDHDGSLPLGSARS